MQKCERILISDPYWLQVSKSSFSIFYQAFGWFCKVSCFRGFEQLPPDLNTKRDILNVMLAYQTLNHSVHSAKIHMCKRYSSQLYFSALMPMTEIFCCRKKLVRRNRVLLLAEFVINVSCIRLSVLHSHFTS